MSAAGWVGCGAVWLAAWALVEWIVWRGPRRGWAGKAAAVAVPAIFGATLLGGALFNMCEGPALLRRLGLPRLSGARTPLQACLGLAVEAGLSCLIGALLLSAAQLASPSAAAVLAAVTVGVGTAGIAYVVVEALVVLLTSDFDAAAPAAPADEPPQQL